MPELLESQSSVKVLVIPHLRQFKNFGSLLPCHLKDWPFFIADSYDFVEVPFRGAGGGGTLQNSIREGSARGSTPYPF